MQLVTSPDGEDDFKGAIQRHQLALPSVLPEYEQETSDDSFTPPSEIKIMERFFEPFGGLDCDPCWHPQSFVRPVRGITREEDSLTQEWPGRTLWMQPPYSDPGPFLRRLGDYLAAGGLALGLVKCDFTTQWWDDYVWNMAKSVAYPKHRIRFVQGGTLKPGAPFLSAAVLWTPDDRALRRDASKRFSRLYGGSWGKIHKLG